MCGNSLQFCNSPHRAKNRSFGNVPFSVLFTTRTPHRVISFLTAPLPPLSYLASRGRGPSTWHLCEQGTAKDDWNANPQIFVSTLGKNEIRRIQFLLAPSKNLCKGFKFCRLLWIINPNPLFKGTPCYFPVLKLHPGWGRDKKAKTNVQY